MPTFRSNKFQNTSWWAKQSPCILCGLTRAEQHSVCLDCWQNFAFYHAPIERHDQIIHAACHYQYPLNRIIQQFKYEQQLQYQGLLTGLVLQINLAKAQAIVPMPISEARLIERGYNQSLLLAQSLAKVLHIPIWQPILRLHQHSQKGLDRLERLANIQQQFKADPIQTKRYQRILVIDDVVTTGASIYALSQALEGLGVLHIQAACIAAAD
jgi:ComF family protein